MKRQEEPSELMVDAGSVDAYAAADFSAAHSFIMRHLLMVFTSPRAHFRALDLGCGNGDFTLRLLQAFPNCFVVALDGSEAMLAKAREALEESGEKSRSRLIKRRLTTDYEPTGSYQLIFSNSLLHHLHDPQALWKVCKGSWASEAFIFVCDLLRPESEAQARKLVATHAAGAEAILCEDFYNSLLAAFTMKEIRSQLAAVGLEHLRMEQISDRHVIVSGFAKA